MAFLHNLSLRMFNKFSKITILTAASLFLTFCGSSNNTKVTASTKDAKIIDGSEQDSLLSPQILRLDIVFNDSTTGFCTGTVIGTNSILTAGHCFAGGVKSATASKPDGTLLPITQAFVHPAYSVNDQVNAIFNDVAIVKTNTPLNLPVLGLLVSSQLSAGAIVSIYGFGVDENGNSGVLRAGTMELNTVTANHLISVFDGLSNTCNGDSGGPATYTQQDGNGAVVSVSIAGITSSGSLENCDQGDVSLFTNLNNPSIISFISGLVPEVTLQ
jgi:secreted trypsin-like serine protease